MLFPMDPGVGSLGTGPSVFNVCRNKDFEELSGKFGRRVTSWETMVCSTYHRGSEKVRAGRRRCVRRAGGPRRFGPDRYGARDQEGVRNTLGFIDVTFQ